MTWLGKVLGGTFGFLMGGPLGAMFGAAIGHQLDRDAAAGDRIGRDSGDGDVQLSFFTATFAVMGHVAKIDGRVSAAEIAAAEAIMNRMELVGDARKAAIRLFNTGKRSDYPLAATLEHFRRDCGRQHALIRLFLELQLEAALADGAIRDEKERLLLLVCDTLRFSRFEFFALKTRLEADRYVADRSGKRHLREPHDPGRAALAAAFATLGLSPDAEEVEVKRAYRQLMSRHHPDKLVAKGMPEEMIRIATTKTQQIRNAFDLIAKARHYR